MSGLNNLDSMSRHALDAIITNTDDKYFFRRHWTSSAPNHVS
jgi:hypothetical protein